MFRRAWEGASFLARAALSLRLRAGARSLTQSLLLVFWQHGCARSLSLSYLRVLRLRFTRLEPGLTHPCIVAFGSMVLLAYMHLHHGWPLLTAQRRCATAGIFSEPERSCYTFVIPRNGFVILQNVKKSNYRILGPGRVIGIEPMTSMGSYNL